MQEQRTGGDHTRNIWYPPLWLVGSIFQNHLFLFPQLHDILFSTILFYKSFFRSHIIIFIFSRHLIKEFRWEQVGNFFMKVPTYSEEKKQNERGNFGGFSSFLSHLFPNRITLEYSQHSFFAASRSRVLWAKKKKISNL